MSEKNFCTHPADFFVKLQELKKIWGETSQILKRRRVRETRWQSWTSWQRSQDFFLSSSAHLSSRAASASFLGLRQHFYAAPPKVISAAQPFRKYEHKGKGHNAVKYLSRRFILTALLQRIMTGNKVCSHLLQRLRFKHLCDVVCEFCLSQIFERILHCLRGKKLGSIWCSCHPSLVLLTRRGRLDRYWQQRFVDGKERPEVHGIDHCHVVRVGAGVHHIRESRRRVTGPRGGGESDGTEVTARKQAADVISAETNLEEDRDDVQNAVTR